MRFYLKILSCQWGLFCTICFSICLLGCGRENNSDQVSNVDKDSLQLLNEMISTQPENPSNLIKRSRILYQRDLFDAALKDVANAIHMDSSRQEWYLLKSKIEMDYFRSMESINTLEKAVRKWPQSAAVRKNLSEAYLIVKQYNDAIENTEEFLQFSPQSSDAYTLLGIIAREQEDTVKAIQYFSEAVQLDADQLEAWVELANLQTGRNNKLAAEYYESALQIAPEDNTLLHSYALFLQDNNELQKAKDVYDRIIKTTPGYANAYYNKGLLLMDQDSFLLAEKEFNSLIGLGKEEAKHFFYRGICREMTNNFESALNDYSKAKSLNPTLPNIDNAIMSVRENLMN